MLKTIHWDIEFARFIRADRIIYTLTIPSVILRKRLSGDHETNLLSLRTTGKVFVVEESGLW